MARSLILETANTLLYSYEHLAIMHKEAERKAKGAPSMDAYVTTFPLIILNACMIEGVLRWWLSALLHRARDQRSIDRQKLDRAQPEISDRLIENYLVSMENNGGWERLKEPYSMLLDMSLDKSDPSGAIRCLFTLRNILAHGTSLVTPTDKSPNPKRSEYPFNWQARLQSAETYLFTLNPESDILDLLEHWNVPEELLQQTKAFLQDVFSQFLVKPNSASQCFFDLQSFKFGHRNRA